MSVLIDGQSYMNALDAMTLLKSYGVKVLAVTFTLHGTTDIAIVPPVTVPPLLQAVCYGWEAHTRFYQARLRGCRVLWQRQVMSDMPAWACEEFAQLAGSRYAH